MMPVRTIVAGLALASLVVSAPAVQAASDGKASQPVKAEGPRVTVAEVRSGALVDRVTVTGTLVARDEILVGPEIDGFRIVELLAEEGDTVARGQVLARLNRDTLDALVAQNDAAIARTDAAIAQAKSQIAQTEVALTQSRQALERVTMLRKNGFAAQANFDTQVNDERANVARLEAARQGLAVSEADRATILAQRQELLVRVARTEVKAPAAGVVSRRTAKLGAVAAMAAEPLFRIIADGQVELEAEVIETRINSLKPGVPATVSVEEMKVNGKVRLVSPEIDRLTRLGRIRIALEPRPGLRIGSFARGSIDAQTATGTFVPLSAVLYGASGPFVQVVKDRHIVSTPVDLGIVSDQTVLVTRGLSVGQSFVVKAGAFLRDGDAVAPVAAEPSKSGAQ